MRIPIDQTTDNSDITWTEALISTCIVMLGLGAMWAVVLGVIYAVQRIF